MDADEDYQNRFTEKWLQHLEDASIEDLVELRGVCAAMSARHRDER